MSLQLPLITPVDQEHNVRWLEELLRDRATWLTAAQILQLAGIPDSDTTTRQIRQLANLSLWTISGQKGYKHLSHATAEEVARFCSWMESQATHMVQRSGSIRKNAHKIFG